MIWSILIFVFMLTLLTLMGLVCSWYLLNQARDFARGVKLEREGCIVKAWIVMAPDRAYQGLEYPNGWAQMIVVFTLAQGIDLNSVLQKLVEAAQQCERDDYEDDDERIIASIMRVQIGYSVPLKIPQRLTGGVEGYVGTVTVNCWLLPKRRLTKPYVYCKAYIGEGREDRDVRMVRYPAYDPA